MGLKTQKYHYFEDTGLVNIFNLINLMIIKVEKNANIFLDKLSLLNYFVAWEAVSKRDAREGSYLDFLDYS